MGAFWATPYPAADADEYYGAGTTGSAACCDYPQGPIQEAVLHLPDTMQDGESYLVLIVADPDAPLNSLRAIGDSIYGEAVRWVTVGLPLVNRLEVEADGYRFHVRPIQPEARQGLFGENRGPTVWAWEVTPLSHGSLRLFIGGSAWPDSLAHSGGWPASKDLGLHFDVISRRIEVRMSWSRRMDRFFATAPAQWFGSATALATGTWFWRWISALVQRRRRRQAGFGRG